MLYLGSDNEGYLGNGYEINGMLDEVCIYNQLLTDEQVGRVHGELDCTSVLENDEPASEPGGEPSSEPGSEPAQEPSSEPGDDPGAEPGEGASDSNPEPPGKDELTVGCGCSANPNPRGAWFLLCFLMFWVPCRHR
jgi:hypothetical protein